MTKNSTPSFTSSTKKPSAYQGFTKVYKVSRRALYAVVSPLFFVICIKSSHKETRVISSGKGLKKIYNYIKSNFDNLVKDLFCVIQTAQTSRV